MTNRVTKYAAMVESKVEQLGETTLYGEDRGTNMGLYTIGLPIEVVLRHAKDEVVIGQKASGSVNDFHRCEECRMGSSYPVPLYDGTPIQCPHCGWTRPHNCRRF